MTVIAPCNNNSNNNSNNNNNDSNSNNTNYNNDSTILPMTQGKIKSFITAYYNKIYLKQ